MYLPKQGIHQAVFHAALLRGLREPTLNARTADGDDDDVGSGGPKCMFHEGCAALNS